MSRVSKINIEEFGKRYVLTISKTINYHKEFNAFLQEAFIKLHAALKEQEMYPYNSPFLGIYNDDLENLEVEVGFDVARLLESSDEIKSYEMYPQCFVSALDKGSYAKHGAIIDELNAFIKANELTKGVGIYYHFLNGHGVNEDDLLTKIFIPVEKKLPIIE